MKKFAALTITLLTAASLAGGITANAADGGTTYPNDDQFIKTLSLSSLTDYAIEDGLYAFATGDAVVIYNGENCPSYPANAVTDVDIKDGVVYYGCADGKAYTIPEQTIVEGYSFKEKESEVLYNGYYYYIDEEGLNVFNRSAKENKIYEGEFSNIKQYGEKVYAIKENSLFEFTGSQCRDLISEIRYADYSAAEKIVIGQASTLLKSYAPIRFVTVDEGAFMTEIDLDKLDGTYFRFPDNKEVKDCTIKAPEDMEALLLCYSGNAAIISIGDSCYVVLKTKVNEIEIDCSAENSFKSAQMIGGMIYASPYIVSGTISSSNAIGMTVKVLGKLDYESVLESVFYEVEYTSEGKSVKGYVAEGFLSPVKIEDNKQPTEIVDPNYSDSNDTKTILIIFAVVLLVLAAIGYLSHLSSKGKKKKKKKEKDEE